MFRIAEMRFLAAILLMTLALFFTLGCLLSLPNLLRSTQGVINNFSGPREWGLLTGSLLATALLALLARLCWSASRRYLRRG